MKYARPGALFGPKVVILVAIWMPKGQVLTTFGSKSCDLGGHLDLYTASVWSKSCGLGHLDGHLE